MCLSADVTGALPPLSPYPCAKIPTRGLVHPFFTPPSSSPLAASLPPSPYCAPVSIMSKHAEAQQAAADGLNELGIQATLMVYYPSKINAPEGILLTTYDQLHSQIAKSETTAYAFPSFGAAQSVMRTLYSVQQTAIFIFECHANTGPAEIAAETFDTCNKYIPAIREIRQLTEPIK